MCEIETTTKLLEVLPKLQSDLSMGKMDTLEKYTVEYSFDVNEPRSPLGLLILQRFCEKAAEDLTRQRGREYGFSLDPKRATDLTNVPAEVCEKLPVHNLDCERDLSVMDKIANRAAACSNRKFTGKSMRDDMTLFQANVKSIDQETRKIAKLLDENERSWFQEQKKITEEKIRIRREKAIHQGNLFSLFKCMAV
jgi:hypothetical protein